MSYSVRFYLDDKKASNLLGEITSSAQNLGVFVNSSEGENYFEFKVEHHLMAHPDEFIPVQFQQKIRPFLSRVTMVTSNYGRYGIKNRDTFVPTLVGSSMVSFERNNVMVVGKNFKLMVKAYMLFCKYNGQMPDYEESQTRQKVNELQKRYVEQLKENRNLASQLKTANAKIVELEPITSKKKDFWNWILERR